MNLSVSLATLWTGNRSLSGLTNNNESAINRENVTQSMTTMMTSEAELTPAERLLLLSKEQRAQAEHILLLIRYVIFAISLPTTICNVVVFVQREMRGATSVYVIGLSVAQLAYIVSSIVSRVMYAIVDNPTNSYAYLFYSIYVSSYLSIAVRRAAYLVMCFVSMERLYAVLRPFHIKEFALTRYPLAFTILTYLFSGVWHVYLLTTSSIKSELSPRTGKQMYVFRRTDLYKDKPDIADGFGTTAPILMTYIPLLGLMAVNVITVWALRRHNLSTKHVQSSASDEARRQQERQMTVTILAASVSYLILSLPYAFHNLVSNAGLGYKKHQKYQNLFLVVRSCTFDLTLLSCAIDFFCFVLLSSSFRKTLLRLLRVRRRGDNRHKGGEGSSLCQTVGTETNASTEEGTVCT